jgi:hypothetical protein
MTGKEKLQALVDSGLAGDQDEAAHMLVDMGEIDSTEHAELLSPKEQERVYGDGGDEHLPDPLVCYACSREAGRNVMDDADCIRREVVKLGPIAEAHRDPTQTYVLACGHTTI